MAHLAIESVSKLFGTTFAVRDFSLEVGDGELVCLLGPSGSGKSTLLRMIGGFERPSDGTIRIDAKDVTTMPPERRPTGMVFQNHALWTHMDVFNNIAFGLKLRLLPKAEIRKRVEDALNLVGLADYGRRMTTQLSGGQQQRVALARSLVLEPKILLLDEPFASLDQHLRERLREEVRDIQQRLGITTLFVTHGQDEALALADRIVVMRDGRTEQIAPPSTIYRQPQTAFVAWLHRLDEFRPEPCWKRCLRASALSACRSRRGRAGDAGRPPGSVDDPSLGSGGCRDSPSRRRFRHPKMVDVDLADGSRLKAMVAPDDRIRAGMRVEPSFARLFRLPRQRARPSVDA